MRRMTIRALVVLSCLLASAFAQEAPKVVSLDPPEGAEVDAKVQTKLVVVFDRAMEQSSYSLCGGGPTFPTARSKPKWISDTTLEFEVELAPDREYRIGLNCQGSANTKSKDGVPLTADFALDAAAMCAAIAQHRRQRRAARPALLHESPAQPGTPARRQGFGGAVRDAPLRALRRTSRGRLQA